MRVIRGCNNAFWDDSKSNFGTPFWSTRIFLFWVDSTVKNPSKALSTHLQSRNHLRAIFVKSSENHVKMYRLATFYSGMIPSVLLAHIFLQKKTNSQQPVGKTKCSALAKDPERTNWTQCTHNMQAPQQQQNIIVECWKKFPNRRKKRLTLSRS